MEEATREVVLNLRRYQAGFLQLLADKTQLEPAAVCQCLIDLQTQGDAEVGGNPLYAADLPAALAGFARQPGDRAWSKVVVLLSPVHFQRLSDIAAGAGDSESGALRHLLADFINDVNPTLTRREASAQSTPAKTSLADRLANQAASMTGTSIAIACLLLVMAATVIFALRDEMVVDHGPHWAGNEASMILDPHTHTTYSDGKLTPDELVHMAMDNGCDALVVSDHADDKQTVSDQQLLELQLLREQYPDFLLFNGIELNMPSYGGREHATLIADPSVLNTTLQTMRDTAERSLKKVKNVGANQTSDKLILEMVADHQSLQNGLLMMYNHPARRDTDLSENFSDLVKWNTNAPVFTLLEGGPGHQKAVPVGKYDEPYLTKDRWDPVVAEIGGIWDQWLGTGQAMWGAIASSDYHNDKLDYPPCAFSRTHLIVPEQSYRGVTMALRSGTFWADHGRILNQLWFSLDIEGLGETAYPGYTVYITDQPRTGELRLEIERGPGSEGRPLLAEFIGSCRHGVSEMFASARIPVNATSATASVPLSARGQDGKSCVLRARVRLERDAANDYLAYTNPIRLILER